MRDAWAIDQRLSKSDNVDGKSVNPTAEMFYFCIVLSLIGHILSHFDFMIFNVT